MKTSQSFITDFFKPKRPRLITDYFKPKSVVATTSNSGMFLYNRKIDYKKSRDFLNKHKHSCDAIMTRNGYCFCAQANFSEYSVYTTMDRLTVIDGRKNRVPKGTCVATAKIDDDSALEHIQVDELFRRQGIGRNLVRFINKCDPQFYVFGGVEHNSRYRLTEEGASLIRACHKARILNDEQVILNFVPQSPSSVFHL